MKSMKKQIIRITESDLHKMVEESVNQIIRENLEDEGLGRTLGNFFKGYTDRFTNGVRDRFGRMKNSAQNGYNNAKNSIQNGYNNAKNSIQNGYNNAKSDIQNSWKTAKMENYRTDMQDSFEEFKEAFDKYIANGGQVNRQFKSWVKGIENFLMQ